jgi:hypothetical protein
VFTKLMKKKRVFVGLSVVVLAIAGAAFAYFTSSGTGTGNATVGKSTAFVVTVDPASGPALLPGSGTDTLAYHVENTSAGSQQVTTITAALTVDGSGDVYNTVTKASALGCKASWFTVGNLPGTLPDILASKATHSGSATVALNENGENENACQNVAPQLTVEAS